MQDKPKVEVCLSPALWHLYDAQDKVVVIIDIFRATSTIVTALHNGAKYIIPTATVEECIRKGLDTENSITAGERDGRVAEGLKHGNSPSEYDAGFVKDKVLVLTTTNGTKILHMVEGAYSKIIGSFLNLSAVCDYLREQGRDVILACAAWKDRVNMEDSLFAGAVVAALAGDFEVYCDSGRICKALYEEAMTYDSLISYLKQSTHYNRLSKYGLEQDMAYCTQLDVHPVVPVYRDGVLDHAQ